jgi:hypothetical protein
VGVLDSEVIRSLGVPSYFEYTADTVGDKVVKGWWSVDNQARGVLGTVGKGYDGVRKARWSIGVGGILPRTVFPDPADSVEAVWAVGNGLLKAPSNVGDMLGMGSSLMGDTRRGPGGPPELRAPDALCKRVCCCCFWSICIWRLRNLSTSISSGDPLSCSAMLNVPASPSPLRLPCSGRCSCARSLGSLPVVSSCRPGSGADALEGASDWG